MPPAWDETVSRMMDLLSAEALPAAELAKRLRLPVHRATHILTHLSATGKIKSGRDPDARYADRARNVYWA